MDGLGGAVGEGGNGREDRATSRGYRDLVAWQKGMEFAVEVYRVTREWPKEEAYGLTSQVRRAAVSIPSNLAEGHGRSGSKEYAHHASIAFGSLCEAETQILLAEHLGYLTPAASSTLQSRIADIRRLLLGLLRSLRS